MRNPTHGHRPASRPDSLVAAHYERLVLDALIKAGLGNITVVGVQAIARAAQALRFHHVSHAWRAGSALKNGSIPVHRQGGAKGHPAYVVNLARLVARAAARSFATAPLPRRSADTLFRQQAGQSIDLSPVVNLEPPNGLQLRRRRVTVPANIRRRIG